MCKLAVMRVDPNGHDVFYLKQRIRPIVNQYEFSLNEDGSDPFCFVEQARFKFKEDIRFFTDDSKAQEILRIKARQRFDPRATYDVTGADGTKVGEIKKVFGKSLIRSTYEIDPVAGEPVAAQERSLLVALIRRLLGFVPDIGAYADWLPIPYHFDFLRGGEKVGSHERKSWKFRDTYKIDMSGDPQRALDRRMVLAMAVGMDALQAR
jgi:uncharacterized protein YxjI